MSDEVPARLSRDEIAALKFAANRQLARWAKKPRLSPELRARRDALKRAVAVLRAPAFAHGCELRSPGGGEGES
jgi:hypothetical protein